MKFPGLLPGASGRSLQGAGNCSSFPLIFLRNHFRFPSLPSPADLCLRRVRRRGRREAVAARPPAKQAAASLTCASEAAKPGALPPAAGAANPRFPEAGLGSGPRARPRRPATRRAAAAPRAPPAGMGVGPAATAPPTSAPTEKVRPSRYAGPDLPARESGAPGQRPRAEGGPRGGRNPSRGPRVCRVGQGGERRRGAAAGQRGPSRGSRGPGSPLSTRPLPPPPFCLPLGVAAAVLRRRFPGCGHFPASLARGPRTGGFCPRGRLQGAPPAAAARRPLPCVPARRPPPAPLRPRPRSPAPPRCPAARTSASLLSGALSMARAG